MWETKLYQAGVAVWGWPWGVWAGLNKSKANPAFKLNLKLGLAWAKLGKNVL